MNDTKKDHASWQFRLEDFSNNTVAGVRLIAARKGIRGRWLKETELPAYVREYFSPEIRDGIRFVAEYQNIAALRADTPREITWQETKGPWAQGTILIPVPTVTQELQLSALTPLAAFSIGDGSMWGVSDWYDDKEEALRIALDADEDFTTGWYGSKKEIASARVTRIRGEVLCEASCSDDFDTEGNGSVTVKIGRKSGDKLVHAIRAALDEAYDLAEADRAENSQVDLWSVHDSEGRWVETYLAPAGWGDSTLPPPGDCYHKWYWQGDANIPAAVKRAFEDERPATVNEFKAGNYTFKLSGKAGK